MYLTFYVAILLAYLLREVETRRWLNLLDIVGGEISNLKVGSKEVGGIEVGGKEVGSKEVGSKEVGSKEVSGFPVDFVRVLLWCSAIFDKEYFSIYFLKLY